MRRLLTKCQSSGFKVRVVWGPACVLEDLEGTGTFPLHGNGWDEGVRVGMAFLVVGPGGQRRRDREGPDASWEIPAVKGLEHLWLAALAVLLPRRSFYLFCFALFYVLQHGFTFILPSAFG